MFNRIVVLFLLTLASIGHAQNFKEQVKFKGVLEVLVEDYFKAALSKTKYYLSFTNEKSENKRIEILFDQTLLETPLTGDEIELEGYFLKESQFKALGWDLLQRNNPIKTTANVTRNAIYFQVNLTDLNATFTKDQIIEKMQMNYDWYQGASYGQTNFPLDVDGDGAPDVYSVTIDRTAGEGCDASAILSSTEEEATAAGIDMSLYQHRVLILPDIGCGWAGLGHLGCAGTCASWIAAPTWNLVYPHELGHNLGMHHAGTDENDDDVVESQYGDGSCPMGNIISGGHFNAPHTLQMDWLSEGSGNVVTVEETASFDLYSLGTDPALGHAQILRIPKTDSEYFYYLSYRPGSSFDQVQAKHKNGVSIHSYLDGPNVTRYHRTLSDGEAWTAAGIRVVQNEKTAEYVKVSVQKDCIETYAMEMTPSIATVYPARPTVFAIELTNSSAADCPAAEIALASIVPDGFTADFEQALVTVNSGETKTVSMQLSTTLLEGQFDITVNASSLASGEQVSQISQVFVQRSGLETEPGLNLSHYNGVWSVLPNFYELEPDVESIVETVSVGDSAGTNNFGLVFTGALNIEEEGNYELSTTSDDGSKFFIDGKLLVSNDGLHGPGKVTANGFFKAGFHPIRVEFFERGGGEVITLHWKKEGGVESEVPASSLFHFVPSEDVPPVVSEGRDLTAKLNHKVILRASAHDPDGYIVTAGWKLIERPAGAAPIQASSSMVHTRYVFKAEQLGVYRFRFYAVDDSGLQSSSVTKVTVVE